MRLAVVGKALRLLLLGAVTLAPVSGCGGDDEPPDDAAAVSWCQAEAVLEAKCQRCHFGTPGANGAGFPLMTYQDTQVVASGKPRWIRMQEVVSVDYMPPDFLGPDVMPPVEPLSASEKQTLLGWLEQGALPTGGTDCD